MKDIFHYGKFEKRIIIVMGIHIIFAILWIIAEQYLTYSLVDNAIKDEDVKLVISISILLLSYVVIQCICNIIKNRVKHHLQRDYSNYARKDIFKKIVSSKINFFDRSNSGELFELVVNDSKNFSTFFTQNGSIALEKLVEIISYLVILLCINVKLTCIIVIFYLIAYASVIVSNRKTLELIKKIRKLNADITRWIVEQINGTEVVKSLNAEENRLKEMKNLLNDYTNASKFMDKKIRIYNIIYDIFSLVAIIIVTCLGGLSVVEGFISYGSLVVFINSTKNIKESCDRLMKFSRNLNQSYVSFIKILKFNEEYNREEDSGKMSLQKIENIELRNINFAYNKGENVLDNINLSVTKQEKIAIVGKTGSGKTTLANLMCRFYNLEDGQIIINGIDYKKYKMGDLREQIGYVLQDVVILKGNVYENINYANKKIENEEIINICKKLNLHSKIMSFENGYETDLTNAQDLLSQGEKQMINFARILVENPSMVILDEVTSSLSYENEKLIKNAINEVMKGRICFVIAHRLSTIKNCDRIVLMKNGRIAEMGNHLELLGKKGEYYKLINAVRTT